MPAGKVTPQQKLISVNDHYGNPQIAVQQGSTIEVFDLVLLDPTITSYEFFKNTNNKVFPFTNLQEGKLQPQESMILKYAYFSLIFQDDTTKEFVTMRRLSVVVDPALLMGTMEMQIENQIVVKEIPMRSFAPEFNQASQFNEDGVYEFQTKIAFLPLLNFQANIKFPVSFITPPVGQDVFLSMTLGGAGAIFTPKGAY